MSDRRTSQNSLQTDARNRSALHLVDGLLRMALAGALVSALSVVACGNNEEDETGTYIPGGGGAPGPGPDPQPPVDDVTKIERGPCDEPEGEEFDCVVVIEQSNDIISCFYGIQFCSAGEWTGCLEEGSEPPEVR